MTELISALKELEKSDNAVIIALDGRCAAGKTTLAKMLSKELDLNVFHMDDFFLRPEQRTPERLSELGGNVDRERFLDEILKPLKAGKPVIYRPFDCDSMSLSDAVSVTPKKLNIVEGSYSCHPLLCKYYDLRVFLDISPEKQMKRIIARNPDKAEKFRTLWIPLEEKYFAAFDIREKCDMTISL